MKIRKTAFESSANKIYSLTSKLYSVRLLKNRYPSTCRLSGRKRWGT